MKIEKIDENKIKVVLTYDDILELNIDITEISPTSEESEKLFSDMLTLASREVGFNVSDSKVMIEAIPSYKEGFVMFVTRLSENKKRAYDKLHIYSFANMEILKFAFSIIKNEFYGKVKIYSLDGIYYLVLLCNPNADLIVLLDFGKEMKSPEIYIGILDEYGEKIKIPDSMYFEK